jgi:hypothetical protein
VGLLSVCVALLAAILHVQPASAQDNVRAIYLPVVKGEGDEEPAPEPDPGPTPIPGTPPSDSLIESARQAGKIDAETALLYQVYAAFGDKRLPAEYRGDDSNAAPSLALRNAQAQMAALSPEAKATLAPFLLPPTAPESWLELASAGQQALSAQAAPQEANRILWLTTCQTDPEIKVWYQERNPEDADDARALCELVRTTILPRLKSLFGRTPPDDSGQNNNGGDGQLDIYLVNARTATVEYQGCFNTPSYILVNNKKWTEEQIVEVVMSAFLNGFNGAECLEYMWLYAASRTWAIDYVLPNNNWEHTYADDYLNNTDRPLNSYPAVVPGADNQIGDGAYLWLWYVMDYVSDAKTVMPAIWENASNPNSLEVVNSAIPGGFKESWAKFQKMNWNTAPVEDYFKTDLLIHSTKPKIEADVKLDGASDDSYALDAEVKTLAAHTFHFSFNDPTVRSVLFINPFHDKTWPTAHIDAIYRMADGTWRQEDWTQVYSKEFCRDVTAERIVDLTLIISNHEWEDRTHTLKPAYTPRLNVTNVACRGWEFEGTATQTTVSPFSNSTETTTVNAVWMREKSGDDSTSHPFGIYHVTEGTGSWTHSGTMADCVGSGSGTFKASGSYQTTMFVFNNATDHLTGTQYLPGDRRYNGFGSEGYPNLDTFYVTYVCPDGTTSESFVMSAHRWFMEEPLEQQVNADGITIEGSRTRVEDAGGGSTVTTVYEWTMTALPAE